MTLIFEKILQDAVFLDLMGETNQIVFNYDLIFSRRENGNPNLADLNQKKTIVLSIYFYRFLHTKIISRINNCEKLTVF